MDSDVIAATVTETLEAMRTALKHYGDALDEAVRRKPSIADGGDTAAAAAWELSVYCLGTADAAIELLLNGHGSQAQLQMRALQEATATLNVVVDRREGDLRRRWLDDQALSHAAVMRAVARLDRQFGQLTGKPDYATRFQLERIHRSLSGSLHARRTAIRFARVEGRLRRPAVGDIQNAWLTFALALSLALMCIGLNRCLAVTGYPEAATDRVAAKLFEAVHPLIEALGETFDSYDEWRRSRNRPD